MARKRPGSLIAMLLPIMFIIVMIVIAPPMFASAEDAHPAANSSYPDEVGGINDMFRTGHMILPALAALMGVAFVAYGISKGFRIWRR